MTCQLVRQVLHQGRFDYSKCYSLLGRSYDESYDDSSDQAFLESIHTMTMMHSTRHFHKTHAVSHKEDGYRISGQRFKSRKGTGFRGGDIFRAFKVHRIGNEGSQDNDDTKGGKGTCRPQGPFKGWMIEAIRSRALPRLPQPIIRKVG